MSIPLASSQSNPLPSRSFSLSFFLPSLHRPRLCRFLPVTPYHDQAQKAAHNSRREKDEDDGYADGPNAGREEVVQGMALVDEGHEESPCGVVEKDCGRYNEHCKPD